ncbi:MAG: hypothetical protein ACI81L_003192 [Verrucomicrobiales bacterium]|jgi:uncharacterized protein YqgC (DUF456 family)
MSDTTATLVLLVLMLVGLIGTLLPVLPGILLMWGSAVAYGFFVGFSPIGIAVIVIVTALSAAAVVLAVMVPKRAAADAGASWKSQLAAALGAVVGFFVIPIVGILVGAIVGIGLAEYYEKRDWELTKTSTIAVAKGFGISAIVQFGIGFFILVLWLAWAAVVLF